MHSSNLPIYVTDTHCLIWYLLFEILFVSSRFKKNKNQCKSALICVPLQNLGDNKIYIRKRVNANLRGFKDACVLCPHLDGIALVVNEGKPRHHTITGLIAPLKHKKANLIGVILNNRTFAIPRIIYDRL